MLRSGRTLVFEGQSFATTTTTTTTTTSSGQHKRRQAIVASDTGSDAGEDDDSGAGTGVGVGVGVGVDEKTPLCCRMFITEYLHIHQREAEARAAGYDASDITEVHPDTTQGGNGHAKKKKKKKKCCPLTRRLVPLVIFAKIACVALWAVGIYYGITCVEELFDNVATNVDPPEESRSFQACVRACLFGRVGRCTGVCSVRVAWLASPDPNAEEEEKYTWPPW